jgi:homoserine O-acetyltransferase
MTIVRALGGLVLLLLCVPAPAADYPAPKQGAWIARDFRFHTGETLPEVKMHYTTVGGPSGIPIVVLHGTGGSAKSMLTPGSRASCSVPCRSTPRNTTHHSGLGAAWRKPSDGLKTKFPHYDAPTWSTRSTGCGGSIRHARLIIGNWMGDERSAVGRAHPDYMDALVPMAAQPTAMASRNWMLRRMMLETIRSDPDYNGGNYTTQPRSMKIAPVFFGIATSGGTLHYQKLAPTNALADKLVDERLAAPMTADANDFLWAWGSSADYDPEPGLDKIKATVLAINAADDERNPPETGVTARALERVKTPAPAHPASEATSGHGTTGNAKFYRQQLQELLDTAPRQAM